MAKGKKSRLNTRLIVISMAVAAAGAGGLYTAYKLNRNKHPEQYIVAGDEYVKQHDYPSALASYQRAVGGMPTNSDLHLKLGKVYYQLRSVSGENFFNCINELTQAEELSPDSKEAWAALLEAVESEITQIESEPRNARNRDALPAQISIARGACDRLAALDPKNLEAQIATSSLQIRVWLLKIAIPPTAQELRAMSDPNLTREQQAAQKKTDDQKIDDAIANLTKLMAQHPENESIPYWIARAKINQALKLLDTNQASTDAPPLFAEAAGEFDNSIAVQPNVIALYLKKADILQLLQRVDPSGATAGDYRRQVRQALDSAQQLADPANPEQYLSAKGAWAQYLRGSDQARSEEVYRDLIKRFSTSPQYQNNSLQYRIELADMLRRDASRQTDALALLDAIPSVPPSTLISYDQRQQWAFEVSKAKLGRAEIEIDQLNRHPVGKRYDDLVADITSSLATAKIHLDGQIPYLRAVGLFQMATNHLSAAIQTMTIAADKSTELIGIVPYDLLRDLANALMKGQQPGKAIELLEGAIAKNPETANNIEIHYTLASLHIQNKDYVHAKPYIDWLVVRIPDEPSVIVLEIQGLGPDADPAQVMPLFKKLPESTPAQIALKLNVSDGLLKSKPESIRLLQMQHKADPGDLTVDGRLVGMYVDQGSIADAQSVIADLKTVKPNDPYVDVLQRVANRDTPEQMFHYQLDLTAKIQDPLVRELRYADLYEAAGLTEDELKHLQTAAKLSPNDTNLLQRVFLLYIATQRYDAANDMLPHLSELNADNANGLMLKTKLALAKKDVTTALNTGRQLTKDFGEFAGSWELYGEALAASGQDDSACTQFATALDKQATNADARRGLIYASVRQGKFTEARGYIADARTRFPDDPIYREMEVEFEIQYGKPESILPSLTQALKDHPEVQKNYSVLAAALLASAKNSSDRGDSDSANKYLDRTKEVYQQAVARWPDNLKLSAGLADVFLSRGDLPSAEAVLTTAANRPQWKNKPVPLTLLAQIDMQSNKLSQAESQLRQALTEDPNYLHARLLLADTLVKEKQYDEALRILKPAMDGFAVREKYVDLLLQLSRGSEAEDVVVAARKSDPGNSSLTNLLVGVYEAEHKADEALKLANEAISADPTNITAYKLRGQLEGSGVAANFDAARKDLRLYCDAIPTDVDARIMLAEASERTQDRDGAIQDLVAAVKYGPFNRQARLMLLREYLISTPPRTADAEQFLTATVTLPQFEHDVVFEVQLAKLYAEKGDADRAVTTIRDAMAHADDKSLLVNDYLSILLTCKSYQLLLDESKGYAADPKTDWPVFAFRGQAKALSGDKSGAADEFQTALDRAGTEKGTMAAREIALTIHKLLGIDKTLEMIAPRAKNSAAWSLVTASLYQSDNKIPQALAAAEAAMSSLDTFNEADQKFLLDQVSSLYIQSSPPQSDKAMAIYHKQVDRNPYDIKAMNNIASVLSDLTKPPRPQDALVWSQKAYDLCKQNNLMVPQIYDTQGWILIQCGKVDDGIKVLYEAIDKSDFPDAHYHLAAGDMKKGFPNDAQRELRKAMDMVITPPANVVVIDPDLKTKIMDLSKQVDKALQADPTSTPQPATQP